jgi:hypothetical protein
MTGQIWHHLPPGAPHVPGFEVGTLLGFGSHGEVWLAREEATGQRVALKVGRPAGADPPAGSPGAGAPGGGGAGGAGEGAAATDRELALLSRLDHPHVVRLRRAVALPDGRRALVLDHAAGGNLAALVAARGPLDPAEVTTILVPLAQALQYLHGRGLTHGDVAPGNILFAADGRPLLSDLGVAQVLGTRGPGPFGTPGFTDPARARGADPRAVDVWGLAAAGWFALTGAPPDTGSGALVRPVSSVGAPALSRLLAECLADVPEGRPDPAEFAARAWQAVQPAPVRLLLPEGRNPLAGAGSTASRAAPPTPPERLARAAAGAARPDAGELVSALRAAPEPLPVTRRVRPADPAGEPQGAARDGSRRSRRVRRARRAAVSGAAVAGVVAVGAVSLDAVGRPGRFSAAPTESPAATTPPRGAGTAAGPRPAAAPADRAAAEVMSAISSIAAARAAAFRTASQAPLRAADEPGSPAMAADAAVVRRLSERGWRLAGVTFGMADVRLLRQDARTAVVTASVTTSAHRQVAADGSLVAMVPAAPPRRVTLTLVAAAGGWRVRAVA